MVAVEAMAVPKPSGPLKAYEGPETEVITMVEVNDGKEMLVHFKGIGGDMDGKTGLYLIQTNGDKKDLYTNKKEGSKTRQSFVAGFRNGTWEIYHPTKPNTDFKIKFSKTETEKMKLEDVLNAYKP